MKGARRSFGAGICPSRVNAPLVSARGMGLSMRPVDIAIVEIEKQCGCNITVSTLLEDIATPEAKAQGLDVADYMIYQLKNKHNEIIADNTQAQSPYTPELQSMISRNKSLKQLIDKLELVEI